MISRLVIIIHSFSRIGGQLSTSLLRMETQLPHMLSSKQELMSTSKTKWEMANKFSFLQTLSPSLAPSLCLSVSLCTEWVDSSGDC